MKSIKKARLMVIVAMLAFMILILLIPNKVHAASETGTPDYSWYTSNTSATSFSIANGDQFAAFSRLSRGQGVDAGGNTIAAVTFSGATVSLTADIDMTLYQSGNYQLAPISGFSGTFDGGGFTIDNALIDVRGQSYQWDATGLFGQMGNWSPTPTVQNVTLTNYNVFSNGGFVGGIVGNSWNVLIQNVRVHGNITASSSSSNVGGISGKIGGNPQPSASAFAISNVIFYGSVTGGSNVGGIAGNISGGTVLNQVAAEANISLASGSTGQGVGGIVGAVDGSTVSNAYFLGTATGDSNVGGIVGQAINTSTISTTWSAGYINGTISSGSTTTSAGVAGIVGNAAGATSVSQSVALQDVTTLTSSTSTAVARVLVNNGSTGSIVISGANANLALATTKAGSVDFPSSPNYASDATQNGLDISVSSIVGDGTINSIFTSSIWQTENGKLPGFDAPIDLPGYFDVNTLTPDMFNAIADVVYNGSEWTPSVTIADSYTSTVTTNDFEIVGYNNNINAGTANITINGKGNFAGTITLTFNILKATPSVSVPTVNAFEGQTIGNITLPSGFSFNGDLSTSVGSAGMSTFDATYTPADLNNYNAIPHINVQVVVSARTIIQLPTLKPGQLTYTGSQQSGVDFDGAYNGVYFTILNYLGTDVGRYVTTFYLLDKVSTVWSDGTTNDGSLTWYIYESQVPIDGNGWVLINQNINFQQPLDPTISYVDPSTGSTWVDPTYGFTPNYESIVFWYSTDNSTWVQTIPTNVGTYYVRAVLSGSAPQPHTQDDGTTVVNIIFNPFTTASVEFNILKIDPPYTLPTNLTSTFGQTLGSILLPSNFTFVLPNTTLVGNVGVNSFMLTYTPADSLNYNTVTNIAVDITVGRQPVTKPTVVTGLIYNTYVQTGITNLISDYNSTTSAYQLISGAISDTLVGSYTVVFRLNSNYMWADGTTADLTLTFTIAKAMPSVTPLLDITIYQYQTLDDVRAALAAGWTIDPSLSYVFSTLGHFQYTVVFTPADTANYQTVAASVRVFVLAVTLVEIPTVNTGLVSNGTDTLIGINFSQDNVDNNIYTISGDTSAVSAGSYSATFTLVNNIAYYWADGSNSPITIHWVIGAADDIFTDGSATVSIAQTFDYLETLNPSITNQTGDWRTIVYYYSSDDVNYSTVVPVNAGIYYVRAFLSNSAGSANDSGSNTYYNDLTTASVRFTILRIDPPNIPTVSINATFGQSLSELTTLLPSGVSFSGSLSTLVGIVGSHVFPGTYTPSDTINYNIVSLEITIAVAARRVARPTVITGLVYNGTDQIGINNWADPNGAYFIVSGSGQRKTAGSFSTTFRLNANFVWADGTNADYTINWAVAKATPAYTLPTNLTAYVGQTLADVALPSGFTYVLPSTTTVGNAGNNDFNVIFTPDDPNNYNVVSNLRVTIVVSPKIQVTRPTVVAGTIYFEANTVQTGINYDHSLEGIAFSITGDTTGTAIDSYSASFALIDTVRYVWADNTTANILLNWQIVAQGNTFLDGQATAVINSTYNYLDTITPSYTVVTGDWQSFNYLFSADQVNWTDFIPINVGSYYMKVVLTNSKGTYDETTSSWTYYRDLTTDPVAFSILPIDPTITDQIDATRVYGQLLSVITLMPGYTWVDDPNETTVGDVTLSGQPRQFQLLYTPESRNYNAINWPIYITVTPLGVEMPTIVYGLVFQDGVVQTGVAYDQTLVDVAYNITGDTTATAVGSYTATFTLTNNYMWTNGSRDVLTLTWIIATQSGAATVSIDSITFGETLDPTFTITTGDWTNDQVVFQYSTDNQNWTTVAYRNAGSYYLRALLTGSTSYADLITAAVSFSISPIDMNADGNITIDQVANQTFSGSELTPLLTVSCSVTNATLVLNVDYTAHYANNIEVGTATIVVDGIGNYTGRLVVNFTITQAAAPSTTLQRTATYGDFLSSVELPAEYIWDATVNDPATTLVGDATATGAYNTFYATTATSDPNFTKVVVEVQISVYRLAVQRPTANTNLTYNGDSQSGITIPSDGSLNTTYTTSDSLYATNQGRYSVTFVLTANYQWIGESINDYTLEFIIAPATGSATLNLVDTMVFRDDLDETNLITINTGDYDISQTTYYYSTSVGVSWVIWDLSSLPVGTYQIRALVQGSPNGNFANAYTNIVSLVVKARDLSTDFNETLGTLPEFTDQQTVNYRYTGNAITPVVNYQGWLGDLDLNLDYNVTFSNNINAGMATMTVTGIGNYTGTLTIYWRIWQAHGTAEIDKHNDSYGDYVTEPIRTIRTGDWQDYQIYWLTSRYGMPSQYAPTAVGTYWVYVMFTNSESHNYSDLQSNTVEFSITPRALTSNDTISILDGPFSFTGSAITPEVQIIISTTRGDRTLVAGTEYSLSYIDNVDSTNGFPTAIILITGIGNFTDEVLQRFEILPVSLEQFSVTWDDRDYGYTGHPVEPPVTVGNLVEGLDYIVTYSDNVFVGTATITITGRGNYTGTIMLNFNITSQNLLGTGHVNKLNDIFSEPVNEPTVTILSGDYQTETFEYSTDNGTTWTNTAPVNVGTYLIRAILSNSQSGNWDDITTESSSYQILTRELTSSDDVSVASGPYVYNANAQTANVVVVANDITLVVDVDYNLTYINNINAGTAFVIIEGIGNYTGAITTTFTIAQAQISVTPAAGQSKQVGAADPVFVYEITPGTLFDGDILAGKLSRDLAGEDRGEVIGTYAYTIGTLSSPNYQITLVDGQTFEIVAATVSSGTSHVETIVTVSALIGLVAGTAITTISWILVKRRSLWMF